MATSLDEAGAADPARAPLQGTDLGNGFAADLGHAVLSTLAYGDVFDFPLDRDELHRRLIGAACTPGELDDALAGSELLQQRISCAEGYYCLAGREHVAETRLRRTRAGEPLYRRALVYARTLASVPFVTGVFLTGALAADNEEADGDVDFLVVIRPGFIWRCHAMIWSLVKLDHYFGDGRLCVNYYVSEDRPSLPEKTLYVAHELALMTPLYGHARYVRMREANRWSDALLPNGGQPPARSTEVSPARPRLRRVLERLLDSAPGRALERAIHRLKLSRVNARKETVRGLGPAKEDDHADGWARQERERRTAEYREEGLGLRGRHTQQELTLCDLDFGNAIVSEHERRLAAALGREP